MAKLLFVGKANEMKKVGFALFLLLNFLSIVPTKGPLRPPVSTRRSPRGEAEGQAEAGRSEAGETSPDGGPAENMQTNIEYGKGGDGRLADKVIINGNK